MWLSKGQGGDETEEFGRAHCEPTEGARVLVQAQQEATEGFLLRECLALVSGFKPSLCGLKGDRVEGQGWSKDGRKETGEMGWAGLGCWWR